MIINTRMKSANATVFVDQPFATLLKSALFPEKFGGIKDKNEICDNVLPVTAARLEETFDDYFSPEMLASSELSTQTTNPFAVCNFVANIVKKVSLEKIARDVNLIGILNNT